jgi:hypothetical protein
VCGGGTVADERIPGTLNVGGSVPALVEAAIYITVVRVDQLTLWSLIASAVVGAWLGDALSVSQRFVGRAPGARASAASLPTRVAP